MDIKDQLLRYWLPLQTALVMLATIGCGLMLAQVSWFFLDPAAEVKAPKISASGARANDNGTNWVQAARTIANREFFGEVVVEEVAPVEQVEAPETKLAFTLQAIIAQGEGTGYAVIAQRGDNGKVFGVGEDLYGQAILSAVYGDRVIIDRRGQLETLRYEKIDSSVVLQTVGRSDEDDGENLKEVLSRANSEAANGGDVSSQVQSVMTYVSQKANEDPEAFIKEMGLEATNGGYQVTRRARQLQMVGLRPGDIVTAVNDSPVGNVASDQVLLNNIMQSGGEVKIQIKRGTRSFTIYQSIPTF